MVTVILDCDRLHGLYGGMFPGGMTFCGPLAARTCQLHHLLPGLLVDVPTPGFWPSGSKALPGEDFGCGTLPPHLGVGFFPVPSIRTEELGELADPGDLPSSLLLCLRPTSR